MKNLERFTKCISTVPICGTFHRIQIYLILFTIPLIIQVLFPPSNGWTGNSNFSPFPNVSSGCSSNPILSDIKYEGGNGFGGNLNCKFTSLINYTFHEV